MGFLFWFATAVFFATYALIATDRFHKTAVALGGASLMLIVILRPEAAPGMPSPHKGLSAFARHADYNVIFTLAGMMIIVNVLRTTGFFQYLAIRAVKVTRADPLAALVLLSVVTSVLSAWLDNVTTVLLIAPVTLVVARQLRLDPVPFLIAEVFASNIGGTATLIGDPPNLLVGSAAGLSFLDFVANLTPIVVVILGGLLVAEVLWLRGKLRVSRVDRARVMELDEARALTNRPLLRRTLAVAGLTFAGFILHGALRLESSVVAMAGAAALLLVTGFSVEKALAEVEWQTLFFFLGLFILVEGAEEVGLVGRFSAAVFRVTGGSPPLAALGVLWLSGLVVGFMNNVSFTAAMIPVVENLIRSMTESGVIRGPAEAEPIWWALALGVCLGGNGTLVGAAANLVASDVAARDGHPIPFRRFLRFGLPCALASLVASSVYLYLRYYA